MPASRFPPPWSVEEQDDCFVVRDQNGQQLAYVYFENEPGRRLAIKLLTNRAGSFSSTSSGTASCAPKRTSHSTSAMCQTATLISLFDHLARA